MKPALNTQSESDTMVKKTLQSLSPTVGGFAERLQRKLQEQEQQRGESEKLAEQRHGRMLQAMTVIRRALQETARIELGARFHFKFSTCDKDGWPLLMLKLIDREAPEHYEFELIASTHDRAHTGVIQIGLRGQKPYLELELLNNAALERLPTGLKRSLREFLELLGAYVVNPKRPEDLLASQTKAIETAQPEVHSERKNPVAHVDLFESEIDCSSEHVQSNEEEPLPLDF